jgi:hypothetical protein
MTLTQLPRRAGPRVFVEPPPDLERRVARALDALGKLPEGLDLPGLPELGAALIELADALDAAADLEPDAEPDPEDLPLFAFADRSP